MYPEARDFPRQCDAPALVCLDDDCEQLALFLNGDRDDGSSSGVVSRDIDLWSENTDFFEIDTVIKRLTTRLTSSSDDTTRERRIIGCNEDGCNGTCQMTLVFEPKESDALGARLSLGLLVMEKMKRQQSLIRWGRTSDLNCFEQTNDRLPARAVSLNYSEMNWVIK